MTARSLVETERVQNYVSSCPTGLTNIRGVYADFIIP
jgi:hypothetical protein